MFYQVPSGGVLQNDYEGGWWTGCYGSSPVFSAVPLTPLAVIATDDDNGVSLWKQSKCGTADKRFVSFVFTVSIGSTSSRSTTTWMEAGISAP